MCRIIEVNEKALPTRQHVPNAYKKQQGWHPRKQRLRWHGGQWQQQMRWPTLPRLMVSSSSLHIPRMTVRDQMSEEKGGSKDGGKLRGKE